MALAVPPHSSLHPSGVRTRFDKFAGVVKKILLLLRMVGVWLALVCTAELHAERLNAAPNVKSVEAVSSKDRGKGTDIVGR